MIKKNQYCETGLSKWFQRPAVEHTWNIFKTQCKASHTALKIISGPTLRNIAYHQDNEMVAELNTNFERMRDEVLAGVHALMEVQAEALPIEAVEEYP